MSDPTTSPATSNATSSPALAAGPTQLDWLDGLTNGLSGQDHAPASHSVSPASKKANQTSATSGRSSSTSSEPPAPLSSWESRLRQRLERIGSTECILTWKASATPAGRPLSRLVPSMRPIEEIDFGLWPTATSVNRDRSPETLEKCAAFRKRNAGQNSVPLYLGEAARLGMTMWPPPQAADGSKGNLPPRPWDTGVSLPQRVAALWTTPSSRDWKDSPGMATQAINPDGSARTRLDQLPRQAALYPTPTSLAPARNGNNEARNSAGLVAIRCIGLEQLGPSEQTEKPGALDPTFVAWLMGFPKAWMDCAPTSMPKRRAR